MSADVYLLKHSMGPMKIGISENITARKKAIQSHCPFKIEVVGIIETDDPHQLEAELHRKYDHRRLRGEWFQLRSREESYLHHLCDIKGFNASRMAMPDEDRQHVMKVEAALR